MGRRIAVLKGNTLKFIHIDIGKLIRKWMIFFNLIHDVYFIDRFVYIFCVF